MNGGEMRVEIAIVAVLALKLWAAPSIASAQICLNWSYYGGVTTYSGDSCLCQYFNRYAWGCGSPHPDPEYPDGCSMTVGKHVGGTGSPEYCQAGCRRQNPGNCRDVSYTPCDSAACGGDDEQCNGIDDDGDGETDETACEPDGPCADYRTDPVHVGTGAYLTHPKVDVRYDGPGPTIEFIRQYTSRDGWPFRNLPVHSTERDPNRLGAGWFHSLALPGLPWVGLEWRALSGDRRAHA